MGPVGMGERDRAQGKAELQRGAWGGREHDLHPRASLPYPRVGPCTSLLCQPLFGCAPPSGQIELPRHSGSQRLKAILQTRAQMRPISSWHSQQAYLVKTSGQDGPAFPREENRARHWPSSLIPFDTIYQSSKCPSSKCPSCPPNSISLAPSLEKLHSWAQGKGESDAHAFWPLWLELDMLAICRVGPDTCWEVGKEMMDTLILISFSTTFLQSQLKVNSSEY